MLVEYIRSRKSGLVGCVVAVPNTETMTVRLGWSKCMVKPSIASKLAPDKFNKQYAIDKAMSRAVGDEGMTVIDAKLSKSVPGSIRPTLRKMAKRAFVYFKEFA